MKFKWSGRWLFTLIYAIIAFIVFELIHIIPFSLTLETGLLGARMNLRDHLFPPEKNKDLVMVTIDNHSREAYGRLPWGRDRYVRLIERLMGAEQKGEKPLVIAFDIIFSGEDRAQDGAFAEALKNYRNVVLAVGYDPSETSRRGIVFTSLPPVLRDAAPACGSIIMPDTLDRRIAALPVFVKGAYSHDRNVTEVLSGFETKIVEIAQGTHDMQIQERFYRIGDLSIPVVRSGKRTMAIGNGAPGNFADYPYFWVNYRGDPKRQFPRYSFCDVSEGKVAGELLKDKVVLVISTIDPNDSCNSTRGELLPGGIMHAFALQTLLSRDFIHVSPPAADGLIFLLILSLCVIITSMTTGSRTRGFLIILLCFAFYVVINLYLFITRSLWLPLVSTASGVLTFIALFALMEHYSAKKILGSLLPASYVRKLDLFLDKPEAGGRKAWATVLFADIRGYTNLSESLSPVEVLNMLNEYHGLVKKPLQEHGGEIFDFQGDAYMVVFGADEKIKDHASKAVKAAMGICRLVKELRDRWVNEGKPPFDVGIGICTGPLALGYVGHDMKLQPAAIGDTTNVAARLQGKSAELGAPVLMTETTRKELDDSILTRQLATVELKGKKEKVTVYTVDV
jgi:adenylate cyclase